jgi:hypothetical protein
MDKTEFLTIYCTFENLDVVRQTLPTVIAETKAANGRLIVHDSSVRDRDAKWGYLRELNASNDFFLLLSDNLSMAHARNMCLSLGNELYAPDYVCMLEDDHGMKPGFIAAMVDAMKKHYGQVGESGLRFGLFTGCGKHHGAQRTVTADGHGVPRPDSHAPLLGGVNSCCRCAPTSHWLNVLKGYDTDEYLISTFQTKHLVYRNYHKGFGSMIVANGSLMFDVEVVGRGTSVNGLRLWDENYAASDSRSRYKGKPESAPAPVAAASPAAPAAKPAATAAKTPSTQNFWSNLLRRSA